MYCTLDDIVNFGMPTSRIAELSGDNGGREIDRAVVDGCISSASSIIDSYIRSKYTLPLKREHEVVKLICVNLAKFSLLQRRNKDKDFENLYTNAISQLKDIQRGVIILDEGIGDEAPQIGKSFYLHNERTPEFPKSLMDLY